MKLRPIYFIFLVSLFSYSCETSPREEVNPAFYYWKTHVTLSETEREYVTDLGVKKLYIKFFDVDWQNNAAVPLASATFDKDSLPSVEIIPTVFITNRTLLNTHSSELQALADKIGAKLKRLTKKLPDHSIREWQFDCDWSGKTRDKYFELLHWLRKQVDSPNFSLSATIRLHQIKYFEKTGVPPVDRGMLMFYNMDNVKRFDTRNSILDIEVAKKYLVNFDSYPLELDIALPIFSWGVVKRNGKMVFLINNLTTADVQDTSRFVQTDARHTQVIKSTYVDGYYLYKDDIIRVEQVPIEALQESAILLNKRIQTEKLSVAFYHLDQKTIKSYPHEKLENICTHFY